MLSMMTVAIILSSYCILTYWFKEGGFLPIEVHVEITTPAA